MTSLSYGPFISRKQAQEQGLTRFSTGEPCKHGHVGLRRTTNSVCIECEAIRGKIGSTSAAKRRYKAKRRQLTPLNLSAEEMIKIEQVYAECRRLTQETGELHHVDHIIPLAKGGEHRFSNLQILTAKVNQKKSAKLVDVSDQQRAELAAICDGLKPAPKWKEGASKREQSRMAEYASRLNVPLDVYMSWTPAQKVSIGGSMKRGGYDFEEYQKGLAVFQSTKRLGMLIVNAKRTGHTFEEWKNLSHKRRHNALKAAA